MLGKMSAAFKTAFAAVATAANYLFGGFDVSLIALFVFMALDYATGVISAAHRGELSSKAGFFGILRKAAIVACVIVAVMLDRLLGTEHVFKMMFCYFMIANEGLSVLENAGEMGVPLPKKLIDALKQLRGENDE